VREERAKEQSKALRLVAIIVWCVNLSLKYLVG
jgi:hypothetical protein